MAASHDLASDRASILGPTLRFKGELSTGEELLIYGQVEGTIGPAPKVTIGPEAHVKAGVNADVIIVEGRVEGNLKAEVSITVRPKANVRGNLEAPVINIAEGQWSDWIELKFDVLGPFKKISGITRFYLKSLSPYFMLYAYPININPADPALPISMPPSFAKELYKKIGYYSTKGMPEDTKALEWGVFDDTEFIHQADMVFNERLRMLDSPLRRRRPRVQTVIPNLYADYSLTGEFIQILNAGAAFSI